MRISVEISLYPLQAQFGESILAFIDLLRGTPGMQLRTNHMSTQVTGPFEVVMPAVTAALEQTLAEKHRSAVVMKIFNEEVDLAWL